MAAQMAAGGMLPPDAVLLDTGIARRTALPGTAAAAYPEALWGLPTPQIRGNPAQLKPDEEAV